MGDMLPRGYVLRRRKYKDGGWLVLPQRRSVHVHVRCYDGRRDPRFALVQRDGRVAARRFARAWVIVERRLEGMDMLADRAEMQVPGLPLGEVVVERRSCQWRKNRRDRHKREHRANAPDCLSIPHSTPIIARRRLHHPISPHWGHFGYSCHFERSEKSESADWRQTLFLPSF